MRFISAYIDSCVDAALYTSTLKSKVNISAGCCFDLLGLFLRSETTLDEYGTNAGDHGFSKV